MNNHSFAKPIDKSINCRAKIWQSIRKLRTFTIRNIEDETRFNQGTILTYLKCLTKAGILVKTVEPKSRSCIVSTRYELIKDMGLSYPKVNIHGELLEDSIQTQIWKCVRIHKSLSIQDIIVMLSGMGYDLAYSSLDRYLMALKAAGYLTKKKGEKNYKLVMAMNTGPLAPMIQKTKQIYDPNIKKVVWSNKMEVENDLH